MTFLDFIMFLLDVILGHTPLTLSLLSLDQTFRLRLLRIGRSDFTSIWIRCSNFICITFASTAGQMFRFCPLHTRRSDIAFIWIRCSDFICITFASTAIRRSDFVFCISGVQTSPLYESDVQTSSASHFLAPQSDVQTSSSA